MADEFEIITDAMLLEQMQDATVFLQTHQFPTTIQPIMGLCAMTMLALREIIGDESETERVLGSLVQFIVHRQTVETTTTH